MSEAPQRSRILTWRRVVATVAAGMFVLFLVDLTQGPVFSFSTRMSPPQPYGDKIMGGVEGPVKRTEVSTNIVAVASGILGLASLPVVITPETTISVNGKLGGFGDLRRGQRVRVAYEVRGEQFMAARVDVLDESSSPSDAALPLVHDDSRQVEEQSATEAASPPTPDSAERAAPSLMPTSPPTAGIRATPTTPPSGARATPWRPVATPRGNTKDSTSMPSAAPRSLQDAERSAAGTSTARPRSAPAPTPPQSEDGAAVIDWLLKESAGRAKSTP